MKIHEFIICSFLLLTSCSEHNQEIIISFTGDVILDRGVDDEIRLHGDSLLVNSIKEFSSNDYFVINYEGTFTDSKNSQNDKYNFKSVKQRASLLKNAGVTHASIANNHIYDFDKIGYDNTIVSLKKNKIVPLGENCEPKILKKGKHKCAILSASLTTNNEELCISSIEQLRSSVKQFEDKNSGIPLIVYIHWGLELQPKPEKWQQELAKDLIELGTDAIIGHHPHVVQTIEFINDKPVFYSIGNFVADAYLPDTDNSFVVELAITDEIKNVTIIPTKIDNYFPKSVETAKQVSVLKEQLSYSEQICAIQRKNSWQIKPTTKVNFQENSSLWLFTGDNTYTTIKKLKSGSNLLTFYTPYDTSNTISLHGKLSEFQIADINNDGNSDILLGISKKVNFDPVVKKRINVFTYKGQNIQALWLGTKFINDIENFDVLKTNNFNYLSTIEIDKQGVKHNRLYEWDDFGFALTDLNQIKADEN